MLIQLEFGTPKEMVALARVAGARLSRGDCLALNKAGIFDAKTIRAKTTEELKAVVHHDHKVNTLRRAQHQLLEDAARATAAAAAEDHLHMPKPPTA